ncbi:ATP-binding protein [Sulfuritalea sp.]|uniref:ATP-binding protein n=1 Tax=Sulfuritalea sp. TaxID=2480090 RepID=UPI001ACA83D0|nr:ATP-binding protein [Sulfuritalea sp.]MBN8475233.1 response regulator [Sulfuritalea sp.]
MDQKHAAPPLTVSGDSLELDLTRAMITRGTLFCAVSALLFAAIYGLRGPVEFAMPHVLAALVLGLIAVVPGRDPGFSLLLAITLGMLLFGYQLLLLASINNGIVIWLLVPFVAVVMLGRFRLAAYCMLVAIIETVGVVVAARQGWLQPKVVVPEAELVMAMSVIAVLTISGFFAYIALDARRRLTRELALRNEALRRALEETSQARNVAVEASQAKERFFANLTHEIRTPLTGIAGTVELMRQSTLSPEQAPLVKALWSSTSNLVDLVNAILDHARMRAGHVSVEPAPFDLNAMASDLRALFGARAGDKGLAFEVDLAPDLPQWIETDGVKLRQIAANLISNALKFTASGTVGVRLSAADGGRKLHLAVSDSGIGIGADKLRAVFEPFVQADESIARSYGGTGLGLAIARQLAQLLGGTLEATSRPGSGSIFSLVMPLRVAQAPIAPAPVAVAVAAPAGAGLRVLLAEDNPVNQLVACAMLQRLQAVVDVAADGEQAVAMAEAGGYHAILMDLQMPGMDGISATRAIRARERDRGRPPLPIIAMTGNSAEDYGVACTAAGMNGFITKPVKLEQLREALAVLLAPQTAPVQRAP